MVGSEGMRGCDWGVYLQCPRWRVYVAWGGYTLKDRRKTELRRRERTTGDGVQPEGLARVLLRGIFDTMLINGLVSVENKRFEPL